MDDLVRRLRGWPPSVAHNVMQDAADRIEALEARIAKADALVELLAAPYSSDDGFYDYFQDDIDAALAAYREGADT